MKPGKFIFVKNLMGREHIIRGWVMVTVYAVLLLTLIVPHHHHEELACYTATHCENESLPDDNHAEEPLDHHHDRPVEQPESCLNSAFYVYSDGNTGWKRLVSNTQEFKNKLPDITAGIHGSYFILDHGQVTYDRKDFLIVRILVPALLAELPPRAPPAIIAA